MFREKLDGESLYPEEGTTGILFFVSGQMSLWPVQGGGRRREGLKMRILRSEVTTDVQ